MTDPHALIASTSDGLADLLESHPPPVWETPSLCADWQVRHVVAHVAMPVRLTPEQFGSEMAAAGGDFTVLSNRIATRDADLPIAEHLAALRDPGLHAWQPPIGGVAGALSHAVIHSLDITLALDRPTTAPPEALSIVLDQLADSGGVHFGIDQTGLHLCASDTDWETGSGKPIRASTPQLIALLSGRTLPDGRSLRDSNLERSV